MQRRGRDGHLLGQSAGTPTTYADLLPTFMLMGLGIPKDRILVEEW